MHSKVRVVLPLWLLAAHFNLPGTDRATLPGPEPDDLQRTSSTSSSFGGVSSNSNHNNATPAAAVTAARGVSGVSGGGGNQVVNSPAVVLAHRQSSGGGHIESEIWSSIHSLRDAPDYGQVCACGARGTLARAARASLGACFAAPLASRMGPLRRPRSCSCSRGAAI